LLIDINFIVHNWRHVLIVLSIVTVLKTVFNVAILHFLGKPWDRAFHSGVVMAQIGEFSFIIVAAGLAAEIITPEGYRLMIAVIALSLLISPMWLAIARRLHDVTIGKRA
jgi:CPA2 family monovalent cation:H+ antiporter-2